MKRPSSQPLLCHAMSHLGRLSIAFNAPVHIHSYTQQIAASVDVYESSISYLMFIAISGMNLLLLSTTLTKAVPSPGSDKLYKVRRSRYNAVSDNPTDQPSTRV